MSNFKCKVKIKKTGEIKEVYAQDDYFGKHKYGYADGEKVYREEEVEITNHNMKEKIKKLDAYDLDTGKSFYYDEQEDNINDIKITENNITIIVSKINELIDYINLTNPIK